MACDSVITSRIGWTDSTDVEMLKKALLAEGYSVTSAESGVILFYRGRESGAFSLATKTMTIWNGMENGEARVKQSYSKIAATVAAKRYGWEITDWTTNAAGNPTATMRRRA